MTAYRTMMVNHSRGMFSSGTRDGKHSCLRETSLWATGYAFLMTASHLAPLSLLAIMLCYICLIEKTGRHFNSNFMVKK